MDPCIPSLTCYIQTTEVRMGKGKGAVDYFSNSKPGTILFELDGVVSVFAKSFIERIKEVTP